MDPINIDLNNLLTSWWFYVLGVLLLILILIIIKKIITWFYINSSYFNNDIYLIRLPKEKSPEENKNQNVNRYLQSLREEIGKGEMIFKALGGLAIQPWYKNWAWLKGRADHFSFEIVAEHNLISFYIVSPKKLSRFLEQQISAYYPEALIEKKLDYNIFQPQNITLAGFVKTQKDFIWPLKTYNEMEADPLNSVINALSKLNPQESIAIQYLLRSANKNWHSKIKSVVANAYKKQNMSVVFKASKGLVSGLFNFIGDDVIGSIFNSGADKNKPVDIEKPKELTDKEKEMLKKMEDKNSKAGLDVNIRFVVTAPTKAQAKILLNNIIGSYSQYDYYQYGNLFNVKLRYYDYFGYRQKFLIHDFIYRRFKNSLKCLLNTEELCSLYHFPLSDTETPNILWLTAKTAPAPANIPTEGISLGINIYRGVKKEIRLKAADRLRHTYIIGKSGVGKTVLQSDMIIQDIENGEGLCVIEPHGDLIEDILKRIPPERADDVIVFSPGDLSRPMGLNLLEYDPRYPEQKSFVINELIGIFDKLYDLRQTGGPMFEQYMRNALLLIMDDPETGSTLMEVPKVLADESFRRLKLSRCQNQTVVDFWRKEAEKAGGEAALANIVPYITSKLTQFIANDMMRPIIGQQKSAFNIREVMDSRKILLVDIPKGIVGEMNAYLLGMIMVGKILIAALSRTDIPEAERQNFYLYIDEFQNFTTDSICQILSEARKYGLGLTIAHQYVGQLVKGQDTKIRDAVFGNVGTMVAFKVGSEDAEFLMKNFAPVFNQYDLINVGKGMAYIKLLVDNESTRPFSLHTTWPILGTKRPGMSQKIRDLSRYKYGQDKNLIEAEIFRRTRPASLASQPDSADEN